MRRRSSVLYGTGVQDQILVVAANMTGILALSGSNPERTIPNQKTCRLYPSRDQKLQARPMQEACGLDFGHSLSESCGLSKSAGDVILRFT